MADDIKIDASIDDLQARLEEESQARRAAEQRATNAESRVQRANYEVAQRGDEVQRNRMVMLDSTRDQLMTQRDILKARHRTALAEGDHDAAAEITVEQSDLSARLLSVENGKAHLQQQIDNPPVPPGTDVRPFNSLTLSERVERIANGLSEKSAAWVRRHPEWAHSEDKVQALVGAHNASVAKGRRADSAEYFDDIERMLEIAQPDSNGEDRSEDARSAAAKAVRSREDTPPPAAPARNTSSGHTRRLTKEEQEYARIAGQTDEEYAASQAALIKEGRITRH